MQKIINKLKSDLESLEVLVNPTEDEIKEIETYNDAILLLNIHKIAKDSTPFIYKGIIQQYKEMLNLNKEVDNIIIIKEPSIKED